MKPFFTEAILKRGKTYFEQNRVFSVNQYDNQTYTGIVLGSEAYHTKITLDEDYQIMSATCDCPYAKEGKHCKHEAALYFAIEDRLPKDDSQYLDVKDCIKTIRMKRRDPFFINYEFTDIYDEYLNNLIDLNDEGKLNISNFQKTIDSLLETTYPKEYVDSIYCMTFECYESLLESDVNIVSTYTWIKENIKYKRYMDIFEYLEPIIYHLNVNQQIDIYQELLKKYNSTEVFNHYVKLVRKNDLDVREYIEKLGMYNGNETAIIEIIRFYIKNNEIKKAKNFYTKKKIYIKSKDGKMKVRSLMTKGHERDYYEYLLNTNSLSYTAGVRSVYGKIKDFYGSCYLDEFMELIEGYYNEYQISNLLCSVNDLKQLCYYILEKKDYRLFEDYSTIIKNYDFEIYLTIALECLKNYSNSRYNSNYFDDNVQEILYELDDLSKVEFIDILKQAYAGKKKYIKLLDQCLEGDENEYDDNIQY